MYKCHAPKGFEPLPLIDGQLNVSVLSEDQLRLSKQCRIMYRRLCRGPATNVELMDISRSKAPTARRSDVRVEVRKYGWDLRIIDKLGGGVNLYALITPNGKTYQREVRQ